MSYILITAAKNEEKHIQKTLDSVINQSILPLKWIIVLNGSTDSTETIIEPYIKDFEWIELIKLPDEVKRDFSAKARAVNYGFNMCRDLVFEIVANIDADISFAPDFVSFLINKFSEDSDYGVLGTAYEEENYDSLRDRHQNLTHVSGQAQFFRKECFTGIGGYVETPHGGVDWIAVTTARQQGWITRTFPEMKFFHHRPMGTEGIGVLKARFKYGYRDYLFGSHPLWQIFRIVFQMKNKPVILSGLFLGAGYFWGCIKRPERPINDDLIQFRRSEQSENLKLIFSRIIPKFRKVNDAE